MRTSTLLLLPALAIVLASGTAAAGEPTLHVSALHAKTVTIRGNGFPDERLLVSVDVDEPHASMACYTDFTRVALVSSGRFEVIINPSKCDFRCGREPSGFVVTVDNMAGKTVGEARFPCVPVHPASGK